jgi:hypothetical protein
MRQKVFSLATSPNGLVADDALGIFAMTPSVQEVVVEPFTLLELSVGLRLCTGQ